jgi:hypothetical protein
MALLGATLQTASMVDRYSDVRFDQVKPVQVGACLGVKS